MASRTKGKKESIVEGLVHPALLVLMAFRTKGRKESIAGDPVHLVEVPCRFDLMKIIH
jgi:hypothetical protein